MLKTQRALTRFRCGHCGDRLVMPTRHLGRLVACHACGRATHPVARGLASAQAPTAARVRKPAGKRTKLRAAPGAAARECANCGVAIGNLQGRGVWQEKAVCLPCHAMLAVEAGPVSRPTGLLRRVRAVRAVADEGDRGEGFALFAAPHPAAGVPGVTRSRGVQREPAERAPLVELSAGTLAPVLLIAITGAAFFLALSFLSQLGGAVAAVLLVVMAAVGVRWVRRGVGSARRVLGHCSDVRRRHGSPRAAALLAGWLRAQPAARVPYALLLLLAWGAMYLPHCLGTLVSFSRPGAPQRVGV